MKRILVSALLLLSLSASPALAGPTLKQQLAAEKAKVAKLQRQFEHVKMAARAKRQADAAETASWQRGQREDLVVIGRLQSDNRALQAQITAQANGGVEAVLASGQTNMWEALKAIWQAFPQFAAGQTCGFDKSASLKVTDNAFADSYTFTQLSC
jgi:hypothetical protein